MAKPLKTAVVRRPKFDLRFITETSEFHIVSDSKRKPNNNFMTESIISMSTKNALADDSSAFSFVIAGDMEWDKILNENDMVILKVEPNELYPGVPSKEDKVKNNTLIVGLVSEVRVEASYGENTKMYRITGQSMAKAFIQFELRAVQNVTFSNPTMGWMDGKGDFSGFSMEIAGNSVAQLVDTMLDRFLDYMKFYFSRQDTRNNQFQERIVRDVSSWEDDEQLINPLQFTNFEGSFNQLLKEIVQTPFCEMFFDVYTGTDGNEKAKFVVRRTPFDQNDWYDLPQHQLSTRDVIEEQLARSDLDAYSIFSVTPENSSGFISSLSIYPQFHPSLVEKYGYKVLDVYHKYLMPPNTGTTPFTRDPNSLTDDAGEATNAPISEVNDTGASTSLIKEYSERLYNWYVMNPNFYSGEIKVAGHPDYRLGNRLLYKDPYNNDIWEFYIESVEHDFSYTNGYTTNLGVTRGLRLKNEHDDGGRFNPPIGKPQEFLGGYLGEMSLADIEAMNQEAIDASLGTGLGGSTNTGSNHGVVEGSPSPQAKKATDFGLQFINDASGDTAYHWGGGRQRSNPLLGAPPYKLDCSSYVYWCYKYAGVQLANNDTGHNTKSIRTSKNLKKIGGIGSGINPRNLTYGDIVFFNNDNHMGIYVGNGEFIAFNGSGTNNYARGCEKTTMTSGYWKDKFQGHVLRYTGGG